MALGRRAHQPLRGVSGTVIDMFILHAAGAPAEENICVDDMGVDSAVDRERGVHERVLLFRVQAD